ncbi:protein of unknown function DUF324 [Beggiatoa sp. PS]|nr:protein of unknown function DUF324 [Beggiatoa sp. PS]
MSDYITLFTGELVQDSALSVGGNGESGGTVDDPLCRDGKGRATLRGTTLAGALIATARKLYQPLPAKISAKNSGENQSNEMPPRSVWQVFTSHPEEKIHLPENRQGVGILQATGAAADGVLFDVETLPRGTRWPFRLAVDMTQQNDKEQNYASIAAAALLEWQRGRCWIGRAVARGLGWLHLENLQAYRLNTTHLDLWPDSSLSLPAAIDKVAKEVEAIPANQFVETFQLSPAKTSWYYIEINGRLRVGERDNGYGIDGLSVGGHAANQGLVKRDDHYLRSKGQSVDKQNDNFSPDASMVLTRTLTGELQPFIPGSALRGPLRHTLSRLLRAKGHDIQDPNKKHSQPTDVVAQLFGSLTKSAPLLVSDAYLVNNDWQAVWLQHHAEDEFSAGVYESSKFDRVALIQGEFAWKLVIEVQGIAIAENHLQRLKLALQYGEKAFLPVGGGQWRGLGWPQWTIERLGKAPAGEDYNYS